MVRYNDPNSRVMREMPTDAALDAEAIFDREELVAQDLAFQKRLTAAIAAGRERLPKCR